MRQSGCLAMRMQTGQNMAAEKVSCPYCGCVAPLVTGEEVYPHRRDLYAKQFYACLPCGAWVGCHPGTTKPLGRLANAHLRQAKMRVHALLDPLWRSGAAKRSTVYARLSDHLSITPQECHVGMFDLERCANAERVLKSWAGILPPRSPPTPNDQQISPTTKDPK